MVKQRLVLTTGGFDPIHIGHVRLFREASRLGDALIVGLNSDAWLTRKKGAPFMSFNERKEILESIRWISAVLPFDDSDGTASAFLAMMALGGAGANVHSRSPNWQLIFAKGGDRIVGNLPESEIQIAQKYNIEIIYGVGGGKIQSSSWLTGKKL